MINIKKGLDVPITGEPEQVIHAGPDISRVAILGADYVGMKPTMLVEVGDRVKLGQPLFTDKKNPGVHFTSPGCGTVVELNRGDRRVFESIVVELDGEEEQTFRSYENADLTALNREEVQQNLVDSGLWTTIRTRPFDKNPIIGSVPNSIFITAMNTEPLSADVNLVIAEDEPSFVHGLQVLNHLTDGKIFLCQHEGVKVPGASLNFVRAEEFGGPHPAGLPGTHIHHLDPVSLNKTVWYVNYQDVIAIGKLFDTGRLSVERIIALAGPVVNKPRLLRTRVGASVDDIVKEQICEVDRRVISGSVISGRTASGPFAYLGRFHDQVCAIAEGRHREFMGWQMPGFNKFSVKRTFASAIFPLLGQQKKFSMTTDTGGSKRAMVPVGSFEQVMPLDILPTFLLRALLTTDTDQAQALGCLELSEDDLALCTYVCPGKSEYGPMLRRCLDIIEKEG